MSVIGVALTASANRPSSIACLEGEETPRLVWVDTFNRDKEFLRMVARRSPQVVAIGSPLSSPRGLHKKLRKAEQALLQVGISIFPTMRGESVINPLIERGIELARQLREEGAKAIETYPHATAVRLFNDKVPKRGTPEKVQFLKDRLGKHIAWLKSCNRKIDGQMCNALLSGLTAWLYIHDKTQELGDEEEGLITIPRKLIQILQ